MQCAKSGMAVGRESQARGRGSRRLLQESHLQLDAAFSCEEGGAVESLAPPHAKDHEQQQQQQAAPSAQTLNGHVMLAEESLAPHGQHHRLRGGGHKHG